MKFYVTYVFCESSIVLIDKVSYLCIVNLNSLIMVQSKKQLSSKPKFTEVAIGDNEAKEMRESAKCLQLC